MINQEFVKEYIKLLIIQYSDSKNAVAEISLLAGIFSKVFDLFKQFDVAFDLDNAIGKQLDIIGRIVGISRNVPDVLPKIFFGFDGDPTARGFADLFDPSVESAPFFSVTDSPNTDLELNDDDYRRFIRLKIANNHASAYLYSNSNYVGIQNALDTFFDTNFYVIDNLNMGLTLFVPNYVNLIELNIIKKLNLLPSGMGVRYFIQNYDTEGTFGFASDPDAKGFGDLFDPSVGGVFSKLI